MRPGGNLARRPFRVPLLDDGTPKRSSLTRREGLSRGTGFRPVSLALVAGDGAPVVHLRPNRQRRADPISAAVRKLVHARDGRWCILCGGYFPDGIELHHRRIKGIGGSTAEHAHCCCALVSLCGGPQGCHRYAHLNRPEAEAEGLIIPRAAEFPFLYSVLVHGRYDAGGQRAWPTCAGDWTADEPEGALT